MTQVTQKTEGDYTVYQFEANNTKYEVLTTDHREYQVFSKRNGFRGNTQLSVYESLTEMAKRSKALKSLATLLETKTQDKQH